MTLSGLYPFTADIPVNSAATMQDRLFDIIAVYSNRFQTSGDHRAYPARARKISITPEIEQGLTVNLMVQRFALFLLTRPTGASGNGGPDPDLCRHGNRSLYQDICPISGTAIPSSFHRIIWWDPYHV